MKNRLFLLFLFLLPALLLVVNIFFLGSQSWGDAPHFYKSEINELITEPLAWTTRGNNLGGTNILVWIAPVTFLYGLIGKTFSLTSEVVSMLVFYLPGIFGAGLGTYFLARYLKLNALVSLFSALFYVFNTYFLLLIDGGQVGMVLAYGVFPFVVWSGLKLIDRPSLNNFYLALVITTLSGFADPRVSLIGFLTIFFLGILDKKFRELKFLLLLGLGWLLVNLYWLVPLFKNTSTFSSHGINLELTSVLHPLFIFSPHWPGNFFGKIQQPIWYFGGLPILIYGGFLLGKEKKYFKILVAMLICAFLAKGSNGHFGGWYNLVMNLPFGFAFRDPSKFFIPIALFAGLLIGITAENVFTVLKERKITRISILVMIYLYILFLVAPALSGRLNFVLSNRQHSEDLKIVTHLLEEDPADFKTLWLPERHPLTFETRNKPALDANTLLDKKAFQRLSASGDWFNFLHDPSFVDWFRVFGIKYLILANDPRVIKKDQKELENWNTLEQVLAENKLLEKKNIGTSFPIYGVKDVYSQTYATNKIFAVVGTGESMEPSAAPRVYFEDGIFDPYLLEGKASDSVEIIFDRLKDKDSLALSFLQKHFLTPQSATLNEWATHPAGDYLGAKYQLTTRNIKFSGLDYNKGLSYSTIKGQKIEFEFLVPQDGDYVFGKRISDADGTLIWKIDTKHLLKGKHVEAIINDNDEAAILNVVALIPKAEFDKAQALATVYLTHFKSFDGLSDREIKIKNTPLSLEEIEPLKYRISELPSGTHWIMQNDSYHPLWKIKRGVEYMPSLPIYSTINGYYVENTWTNLTIEFTGQKNVRWGMYFSALSVLGLAITYTWKKLHAEKNT